MTLFPLACSALASLLLAPFASAQVVGPNDYVAYWNLDEGSGLIAQDSSANGLGGLISGAQWTSGVSGSALEFDGLNDFVELTDGNGYPDLLANLSVGTISIWFRFDNVPPTDEVHPILELGNDVLGNAHSGLIVEVGHFLSDTKLFFTIYEQGHVIPQCFDTGFSLQPGRWYHFAAVVGTGYNTGYLDGVELTNRHYNYGGPTTDYFFSDVPGPQVAWLGRGRLANILIDQHLDGAIDEVRIYDRPLSSAEIQQYYQDMTGGGGCPPAAGPTHCEARSPGVALPHENPIAPAVAQLATNQIEVVILGHGENLGYETYLQQLLDASPPIAGTSYQVTNLALAGGEAWKWSTPGQEGYQRIETLLQSSANTRVVLGMFTNNQTYPILVPAATDPNYTRFVDDLIAISSHLRGSGQGADFVYLSAHRYMPANFLPCWNENCAIEGVMQVAASTGMDYVKPGPEQHDLSWCCYPTCYAADGAQPNALGRQLMAEAWYAFLVREFSGIGELCRGSANSSGAPATLSVAGTTSLSANDLVLNVSAAVPQQFGLFFYADGAGLMPFGDGTLCLSGQFHRLNPPLAADGLGSVTRSLDSTQPPANSGSGMLTAGSTWNFQYWYRDPFMAGAGFGVSSAVSIGFQP